MQAADMEPQAGRMPSHRTSAEMATTRVRMMPTRTIAQRSKEGITLRPIQVRSSPRQLQSLHRLWQVQEPASSHSRSSVQALPLAHTRQLANLTKCSKVTLSAQLLTVKWTICFCNLQLQSHRVQISTMKVPVATSLHSMADQTTALMRQLLSAISRRTTSHWMHRSIAVSSDQLMLCLQLLWVAHITNWSPTKRCKHHSIRPST